MLQRTVGQGMAAVTGELFPQQQVGVVVFTGTGSKTPGAPHPGPGIIDTAGRHQLIPKDTRLELLHY